jgi:hypothetical protein
MLQVLYTASTEGNTLIMKKKLRIGEERKENGFKLYLHQQRETEKKTPERQRRSSGVETRGIDTETVKPTDKQKKEEFCCSPLTLKLSCFLSSLICRPQISERIELRFKRITCTSLQISFPYAPSDRSSKLLYRALQTRPRAALKGEGNR